jgi:hypothetical protein
VAPAGSDLAVIPVGALYAPLCDLHLILGASRGALRMVRHRSHSIELKRQIAQEFLAYLPLKGHARA